MYTYIFILYVASRGRLPFFEVGAEVTFGRGDLSACPLGGFTGADE